MISIRTTLIALLPGALLSACVLAPVPARRVVYERPVPAYGQPVPVVGGDSVVVDIAPPAPYVEAVSPIPFAGAFWIGGYWGWRGGRHEWVPGRWEHPRPGYAWRSHAWAREGGRWHLHGGGWDRR